MEIKLKGLTYENFKGAKKTTFTFKNAIHTIAGDNKKGKTRTYDALLWLLFDKDSTGKKDFAIKPLDENNKVINKLTVSVSADIDFNGNVVELKKDYKEKWTKQRGSEFSQLTGHTTDYFFDGVPKTKKEFVDKVALIINEDLFRLITDIFFFNTQPWKYRRDTLSRLAGDITDEQISKESDEFARLFIAMKGKDISEYRSMLKLEVSTINKRSDVLPTLVNENKTTIDRDVESKAVLDNKIVELNKAITQIDEQIKDKSQTTKKESDLKIKLQQDIFNLKTKKTEVENKIKTEQSQTKNTKTTELLSKNTAISTKRLNEESQLSHSTTTLGQYNTRLADNERELADNKTKRADLKEMFGTESANELKYDDAEFVCPTCLRKFESDNIDEKKAEILKNFNFNKSTELEKINKANVKLKERNILLQDDIEELKFNIENETKTKTNLEASIKDKNKQGTSLLNQIEAVGKEEKAQPNPVSVIEVENLNESILKLEAKYNKKSEVVDTTELTLSKNVKTSEIDSIKSSLNIIVENGKKEARIEELEAEELKLNGEKALKERELYILDKFEEAKVQEIEKNINSKFTIVKFKMFNKLINGGTEPTCVTLVDGVPYDRGLNTASRINAGIDIINAISKHTDKYAPIFVDNAESVSEIIPTKSQLVRLEKVTGLNELILS